MVYVNACEYCGTGSSYLVSAVAMGDRPQPSGTGETGEEVHAQRGRGQQDQLNSIAFSKRRNEEREVLSDMI